MNKDKSGRPWLKISEAKAGVLIEHDNGSNCWYKNRKLRIYQDEEGPHGLYFKCRFGRHYLYGQEQGDHYVGLYLAK